MADAQTIAEALAVGPVELCGTARPPSAPGFYAWWVRDAVVAEFHPAVPLAHPSKCQGGWSLLYVGISPHKQGGGETIASRVEYHRTGLVHRSTVRYSIASLLPSLQLRATGTTPNQRKPVLAAEQPLTDWMETNTWLSYCPEQTPWFRDLERSVIQLLEPPLNSAHSLHPFKATVRQARAELLHEAKAASNA